MMSDDLNRSLPALFAELVYGARGGAAYMLNAGDAGLLRSLDHLSAEAASASCNGGATIAAHADHLRYGLSLMNRWTAGVDPFPDADWSAAWKTTAVSESEWARLREDLRAEVDRWHAALQQPRSVRGAALDGMISSIAHLAYHLGAIRQIQPAARGPMEGC